MCLGLELVSSHPLAVARPKVVYYPQEEPLNEGEEREGQPLEHRICCEA
jgi:hypothetical protein